jgi:hypothetical protein
MAETLVGQEPTTPASPAPVSSATTPTAPVSPVTPAASDWRATWTDAVLKNDKTLEKFKGVEDLARSYKELEAYQGKSIRVPGADATPEQRREFEAKLDAYKGVPEDPTKYTITAPEGAGTLDPGAVSQWQQTFHRLRLTDQQVAGLTSEFFGSPMGNPTVAGEQLRGEAERVLRAEWGGGYAYNLSLAQAGARQTLGQEFVDLMETTGLGNHPVVIKACRRLGQERKEHGDLPANAQTGNLLGPEAARQRIAEIRGDKTHPFHKGDKDALTEMTRLYELRDS